MYTAMRSMLLLAVLVLLALVAPASPAHAGVVVSVCDEAHLRAALAGGGTVTFTCSGTIILASTITIADNSSIDGSGQAITISGNNSVGVLRVNSGVILNLNGLTIARGNTEDYGGGIDNQGGTVTASHCTFSQNRSYLSGGAINSFRGTLTISSSTFSGNRAAIGSGGAILNSGGTLTISNSTFSDNRASSGGGIAIPDALSFGGAATISNSTFSDNDGGSSGGGISVVGDAELTVTRSVFSGNRAGYGGGIDNGDTHRTRNLVVRNCTFTSNHADYSGGGINNQSGTLTVSGSTFSGNRADIYGGGAISTFFGGTLMLSNSTFSVNRADTDRGGGIILDLSTGTISNSTFSGNSATHGGNIYNSDATITLENTIVANSPSGGNCYGTIVDGGGNLSYPDTTCPGINADPKLSPLQNNGGPTFTMALGSRSAALDAANDATCTAPPVNSLDQRGVARPQGPHCDIGAVEQLATRLWLPAISSR